MHILAYREILDDGRHVQHGTTDVELVVDRDKSNLRDLSDDIVHITSEAWAESWNESIIFEQGYKILCNLTLDSLLMDAFCMYSEWRPVHFFSSY